MDKTTTKNKKPRLQLIISVLVLAILFLAELYAMINQPSNVILLVGIGILVLIALYFVMDAVLDCVEEKDIANREQLDTISRSEKAAYMLLRKNMDEMLKSIQEAENKSGSADEIVNSQKAIAKVTMNKSRENTEMIMAANKAVFNKITEFEAALNGTSDAERMDQLFMELNNLEASLNDRLEGLAGKLSGFQEEIERLVDHIAEVNKEAIHTAAKSNVQVAAAPVEDVVEDTLDDLFVESVEDDIAALLGESVEESLEEAMDISMSDSEEELNLEALFDEVLTDDTPMEDTLAEDILLDDIVVEEPAADESVVESVPEEKPPMPDMSNPNKIMTPEEIAALIAGQAVPAEEPALEPEPVVEEPIVESVPEEKPPMPDMSNPNKVMTPEEIAALIANM